MFEEMKKCEDNCFDIKYSRKLNTQSQWHNEHKRIKVTQTKLFKEKLVNICISWALNTGHNFVNVWRIKEIISNVKSFSGAAMNIVDHYLDI